MEGLKVAQRILRDALGVGPDVDFDNEEVIELHAKALWAWSWTVDQGKAHKPYPYERLIEATKEDLRECARGLLRYPARQGEAEPVA